MPEPYQRFFHDYRTDDGPTPRTSERAGTGAWQGGEHTERADGVPKVKGEFEYSSDLWMDGMLWGATLRSPHPHANIWSIDTSEAEELPGVHAVLTHEDVPGRKVYGMEVPDQPVLAWERVRYQGEPVAVVAADHPETARRALEKISVEYEVLDPLTDPEEAMKEDAPRLHLSGNVLKHITILRGDVAGASADVVVKGEYEIGMQDQAFLGPESGLAVPDGRRRRGPVHLDPVASPRPGPGRRESGPGSRAGTAHPLGRGRRVRRAGGPLDADPRLHARARHRPPGEDGI